MSPLARMEMRTEAGVIVATVVGEVDISNAADLGSALEGAVAQRAVGVVFEPSRATYIDSAGIHLLFRLGGRLTRRRQQLRVVVPDAAPIRKIINLAGLGWTVPHDKTVPEALVRLRAEVAPQLGEEAWVSPPDSPHYY
jgi:anti-anti-sigma factor